MNEALIAWILIAGAAAIIISYLTWVALAIIFGWQALSRDDEGDNQ